MRSIFGRAVERHPIMFADGASDEERSFGLFGFGGYSPREKQARGALAKAAYEKELFTQTFVGEQAVENTLWEERLARIKHLTGVELANPHEQTSHAVAMTMGALPAAAQGDYYFGRYKDQLAALAAQYPEHGEELKRYGEVSYGASFSDEEKKAREVQALEDYKQAVADPYLSGWQKSKTEMGGVAGAIMSDPWQTLSMLIPGVSGVKGASVLSRIGRVMLAEAAINAGTETALQMATYGRRREIGINVSVGDSLSHIGTAAMLGAGFGGLLRGGGEVVGKLISRHEAKVQGQILEALVRVDNETANAADLKFLAKKLDMPVSDIEARVWRMAEAQDEIARLAFGDVPDMTRTRGGEVRSTEQGSRKHGGEGGAPEQGMKTREAGLAQILDDGAKIKLGTKIEVAGRPVEYRSFAPEELGFDADNYQYKSGGDAQGVNGRLKEVTSWDGARGGEGAARTGNAQDGAGKVLVHERKDGMFIVDGHQRLELAKRLNGSLAEGGKPVKLNAHVFKQADGWSVEDVRALAAQKNIQEGSGAVLDGARAMRARPEIIDDGLPWETAEMKDMLGLARLSDEAFAAVESGVARQEYGALVGRVVADENRHLRVLEDLGRAQPRTQEEAAGLVRESLETGQKRERPDGFGGGGKVENEPELLQPQRAVEPADVQGLDVAQKELAVMEGRLADKPEVARMWEDMARSSIEDMGFMAKQADVMASVVRACRL